METTIYVLRLKNGKYYVGPTGLEDHLSGNASPWTQNYPPEQLEMKIPGANPEEETNLTIEYMARYGIENVRGGSYCQIELDPQTVEYLSTRVQQYWEEDESEAEFSEEEADDDEESEDDILDQMSDDSEDEMLEEEM